jgi:hypothetical protein
MKWWIAADGGFGCTEPRFYGPYATRERAQEEVDHAERHGADGGSIFAVKEESQVKKLTDLMMMNEPGAFEQWVEAVVIEKTILDMAKLAGPRLCEHGLAQYTPAGSSTLVLAKTGQWNEVAYRVNKGTRPAEIWEGYSEQ